MTTSTWLNERTLTENNVLHDHNLSAREALYPMTEHIRKPTHHGHYIFTCGVHKTWIWLDKGKEPIKKMQLAAGTIQITIAKISRHNYAKQNKVYIKYSHKCIIRRITNHLHMFSTMHSRIKYVQVFTQIYYQARHESSTHVFNYAQQNKECMYIIRCVTNHLHTFSTMHSRIKYV